MKTKISDDFVRACAMFRRMPSKEFPEDVAATIAKHVFLKNTCEGIQNYVGNMYYAHKDFVEEYIEGQKLVAEIMKEE